RALSGSLAGAVLQVQLIVAGAVLLVGVYASNVFLVDLPLGRLTTRAYLATAVVALLLALATRRLTAVAALRARLERVPRWSAAAATLALFGGAGVFADAVILPGGVPRLHRIALVLVLFSFAAVGAVCARRLRLRSVATAAGAATLVLLAAWAIADRPARRLVVQAPPTVHALLLQEARSLLDRDGDGYSALLCGGDCDDADPRAYPLSRTGRDCLGWLGSGAAVPQRAPLVAPAVPAGPGIIVMVTIDAFRCGFGQDGTGAFRDICPHLTALAGQGRIRLDAHTIGTSTESAMQALH